MDWKDVYFNPTFNIPEQFNFQDMIADKATSLKREDLREASERGSIGSNRSVIIQWMRETNISPLEFLTKISEHGFSEGNDVIGGHPKEREMKIYPRLYGLLTLEKRLYVVLTEALIASCILRYFPEITMTFDQKELLTRYI